MSDEWDENSEYLLKPLLMEDGTIMSYMKVSNFRDILQDADLGEIYAYKMSNGNVSAVYWDGNNWQNYFIDVKGLLYKGPKLTEWELHQKIEEFYGAEIG